VPQDDQGLVRLGLVETCSHSRMDCQRAEHAEVVLAKAALEEQRLEVGSVVELAPARRTFPVVVGLSVWVRVEGQERRVVPGRVPGLVPGPGPGLGLGLELVPGQLEPGQCTAGSIRH
jgi:hypothetical protein